jgi:hypothetical protein
VQVNTLRLLRLCPSSPVYARALTHVGIRKKSQKAQTSLEAKHQIDGRLLYRPTDRESLQREARQLAAIGLKTQDISEALRLGVTATETLLRGSP